MLCKVLYARPQVRGERRLATDAASTSACCSDGCQAGSSGQVTRDDVTRLSMTSCRYPQPSSVNTVRHTTVPSTDGHPCRQVYGVRVIGVIAPVLLSVYATTTVSE